MKYLCLFLVLALGVIPAGRAETEKFHKRFGKTTWKIASPESAGYDSRKLSAVEKFIKSGKKSGTTGLVVAVNGKIIYAYGNICEPSAIGTCRASVLSMLYGKYVKNGKIKLDTTIGELGINDRKKLLKIEKTATIADLLTLQSGIYHPYNGENSNSARFPGRGSVAPGTTFMHNIWDFNAAGTVFEQLAGVSIYRALQNDLAAPLGMEDFSPSKQKKSKNLKKSIHPAYNIVLSTRDMARIGEVMRNNGVWQGNIVVPEKWAKLSTSAIVRIPPYMWSGYGYFWYKYCDSKYPEAFKDSFSAQGSSGQYITVLPALNMVMAHKSARYNRKTDIHTYRKILHKIIEARKKTVSSEVYRR